MEVKHRNELVNLLRHLSLPLTAVEVGCAEGFNAADLLREGLDKLYMVDAWKTLQQSGDGGSPQSWHDANYNAAMARVAPFGDKTVVLRGISNEMVVNIPNGSLGLVYLDGDHSYHGVKQDISLYFPKLVPGGILAGHDIENDGYGVKKAVTEFCEEKGLSFHIITEDPAHPEYSSFWIRVK